MRRVARRKMKIENVKKGGVYEKGAFFIKPFILIDEQVLVRAERGNEPRELQYFGKIIFYRGGDGGRSGTHPMMVSAGGQIGSDPVNIGGMIELPVIAVLIL